MNSMRRDELNRKVFGWLRMAICAANASMGHHGRKNYCGNLLWQSCLTLLGPSMGPMEASELELCSVLIS